MRAAALAGLVWASAGVVQAQTAQETTDAAVRGALWCVGKAEEAFRPEVEPTTFEEIVADGPGAGFQLVFGQMSMAWVFHPTPTGDDAAVMIFGIPGQCGGQSLDVGDVRQAVETAYLNAGFATVLVDGPDGERIQLWHRTSALGGVYAGVVPAEEAPDRVNFFAVEEPLFLEGLQSAETDADFQEEGGPPE
ncbi:hypothetical protein [Brevundimonas sp.]|jgi:hypothetical protein|uniref:hypothetical protein n=1 Tax=Brevundimonas sp. TaxID=1871086 RepID=UPI002E1134BD|nr:hypothetical protein [Brevundimonas sp.]